MQGRKERRPFYNLYAAHTNSVMATTPKAFLSIVVPRTEGTTMHENTRKKNSKGFIVDLIPLRREFQML